MSDKKFFNGKRGISAVVATVLIILITIAAVTIVWSVVIPMIKDNLENTEIVQLSIETGEGYTAWDERGYLSVQVRRGSDDAILDGIRVIFLLDNGSSVNANIDAIEQNQAKTFVFNLESKPKKIFLAPIINGVIGDIIFEITNIPNGVVNTGGGYYTPDEHDGVPPVSSECTEDCEDNNPCTSQLCINKKCEYTNLPNCNLLTSCGIITTEGKYYLSQDLTDLTGDNCITIDSDDVILDCQNHKINDSTFDGSGVFASQVSGITIKNCEINTNPRYTNGAGIKFSEVSNSFIENNVFESNQEGLVIVRGSGNSVTGNEITLNRNAGIHLIESSSNTIDGNTISSNGGGIIIDVNSSQTVGINNIISETSSCWNRNFDIAYMNLDSGKISGTGNIFTIINRCADAISCANTWPVRNVNYQECVGTAPTAVCGNDVCEYSESYINCKADCPDCIKGEPRLAGDANCDCRLNLLDLILIRNRLSMDVNTGDNWKADINEDGRINLLDLIYVRNNLNTAC